MLTHPNGVLSINFLHVCVACRQNEYIDPTSVPGQPICIPCPLNSVSDGGNTTMCTCNSGTGRVNTSDVTLPCLGEYHYVYLSEHASQYMQVLFSNQKYAFYSSIYRLHLSLYTVLCQKV